MSAVQAFICCRLDYCNSMPWTACQTAFCGSPVHSERRRTSGHRSSTMRPYHTGAALAACPSTSWVQGCMPGTPVSGWSDTRIHSRRHPTRYGQWSPSATFSLRQDMPRSTDAQLQRAIEALMLQACVWNSLWQHLRRDMNFARFKRQLKTFLFGSTTAHCVCLLFCALEILLLTYRAIILVFSPKTPLHNMNGNTFNEGVKFSWENCILDPESSSF